MPGLSAFSPLALRVGKNLGYLFYILMSAIYHNLFLLLSISHCPGGSWVASFLQQCCLSPVLCPLWAAGAVAELGGSWGGSMGSDAPLPPYLDGRRHSWDLFLLLLSPSTPCGSSWVLWEGFSPTLGAAVSCWGAGLGVCFHLLSSLVLLPQPHAGVAEQFREGCALLAQVFHIPAR